ncbi:hypothetical protein V6N11_019994 [Hibiscus sabdariffa]|uniref:Squalene monooxygenase n=1 Tax=Hibiscus sabdariffa TaxID=183260 RepID=A0ABR2A0P0_9ROSI
MAGEFDSNGLDNNNATFKNKLDLDSIAANENFENVVEENNSIQKSSSGSQSKEKSSIANFKSPGRCEPSWAEIAGKGLNEATGLEEPTNYNPASNKAREDLEHILAFCVLGDHRLLREEFAHLRIAWFQPWFMSGDFSTVRSKKERSGQGILKLPILHNFIASDKLDNIPFLLSYEKFNWGPRPFKLINAWLSKVECIKVVKETLADGKTKGTIKFSLVGAYNKIAAGCGGALRLSTGDVRALFSGHVVCFGPEFAELMAFQTCLFVGAASVIAHLLEIVLYYISLSALELPVLLLPTPSERTARHVHVIERDMNAPYRFAGENLMPGGYLKLIELGLEECVDEIGAKRFLGFVLYKDGMVSLYLFHWRSFSPMWPEEVFTNGCFVQNLSEKDASLHKYFIFVLVILVSRVGFFFMF